MTEEERLREAMALAENRLEAALLGPEVCRHCVELARSYLKPKKARAPRGTFDRTAYQRELMRKRRAAKKEGK